MVKISVVNISQNYYVRGGSDRYFFSLGELLEKHGHQVIPFASNQPQNQQTDWSKYFPRGVDFEQPNPMDISRFLYSAPAAKAINRLVKENQPQIAHLHIYYGQLTSSILSPLRKAGIPIIQTLHEYKLVCPVYTMISHGEVCEDCQGHDFWKAAIKKCNRDSFSRSVLSAVEAYLAQQLGAIEKVDHFITVSDFQRRKLIELGVPQEKLTRVHNFIDISHVVPSQKQGEYFLYFGRLEKLKGIFTLVEAAAAIPDVPLIILGDGEAREELETWIEERGITHIKVLGAKGGEELKEFIANSICSILPSEWYENCPLAVLESLAYGRPVIGTNIGGIPELIIDGVDGYIVPCKDVAKLRARLVYLAEHRDEALEMGAKGRKKVETQFCAEKHYQEILDVYHKVIK